jgi:hypothetical protein
LQSLQIQDGNPNGSTSDDEAGSVNENGEKKAASSPTTRTEDGASHAATQPPRECATAERRTLVALPVVSDPERNARTETQEYIFNLPDSDTVLEHAESAEEASHDKLSFPKTFLTKVRRSIECTRRCFFSKPTFSYSLPRYFYLDK